MCHGCEGNWATVQPQDVRTLFTSTSDEETLVSQNVNRAVASPAEGFISLTSASHFIAPGFAAACSGDTAATGKATMLGESGAGGTAGEMSGIGANGAGTATRCAGTGAGEGVVDVDCEDDDLNGGSGGTRRGAGAGVGVGANS